MLPGDQLFRGILNGQVDGGQLGNALFDLLPALPNEGPPFMPRAMAKQLFPRGFLEAAVPAPAPIVPPAPGPAPPAPRPAAAPTPAAPAREPVRPVGEHNTDPGRGRAIRVHIAQRRGM